MTDKRSSIDDVITELRSGMSIAIGGWGSRRKPMSLIRAIARSNLTDLTLITWGGPDLGILCAAGKVRKAVYAFCSLDSIPLEPHFRAASQQGAIEHEPYDEGLFHLSLQAAAWRVPFLPARAGLGSDLFRDNPRLLTVRSPYEDGEEFVATPALQFDAVLCHVNRADARGNGALTGADPYWDEMMLAAAPPGRRFITTELVVDTSELRGDGCMHHLRIPRAFVDAVIESPRGAHFTSCDPDYGRDEPFQAEYARSARSGDDWARFRAEWVDVSEADYQRRLDDRMNA